VVVQPILFPPQNLINEPELFFRGINSQNILENRLIVPAGSELSLETYFNAFSIGKWLEYTNLDNLSLHLTIQGEVEIKAYHAVGSVDADFYAKSQGKYAEEELIKLVNEKVYSAKREEIDIHISQEADDYTVIFPCLYKDGIIYITIRAITDAIFYCGTYSTEYDESLLNPVKIAIGICTFKREQAVYGNVDRIISKILNNPKSPLTDKLEVYIADNGQTIDINHFNNPNVHILPNPNLGGTGGFTRTMIEAMFYDRVKAFTHIIFMDDDILLYPPVLERTYYLLRMLKKEYQKAILGAANMVLERPNIQQESGSLYRDETLYIGRANHKFFNMNNKDAVAANEVNNQTNYNGWWYACIPKTIVNEKNLPMPYFIHYDDAEYGLRNINNKGMFINGICVWHPALLAKSPFWMTYYDVRNRLITMFSKKLELEDFKEYLVRLTKRFIIRAMRYEYLEAQIILESIQDFLKGPEFFEAVDALDLHSRLLKKKETLFTPEEVGVDITNIVKKRYDNFKRAVIVQTLCNILPAKNGLAAINTKYFYIPYNASKIYLYNDKIGKGTLTKRNTKKFFRLLFYFLKVRRELKIKYKEMLRAWPAAKPTFTSLSFWEKYLGLNKRTN